MASGRRKTRRVFESSPAASALNALYVDEQACRFMRQKPIQQRGGNKKGKLPQTRACMLLPAPHSRPPQAPSRRRPQHQRRPPFTTHKPASKSNTTQRREQKGRGKNTMAANRLLYTAYCKLPQTRACMLLPAPHSRRKAVSKHVEKFNCFSVSIIQ